MSMRVIQGFFPGGTMRTAYGVTSATTPQVRSAPPPAVRALASSPGPAFANRPNVAQPKGGVVHTQVDPTGLGLARSGGQQLPGPLLAKMEAAFGADFSSVRVHVGPQAARIGAIAFTTGNDLYFAPGRYQPDSVQGQQLIGHELAHVIQQRQGRVRAPGSGVAVVQDHALEAEADRLGAKAAMHRMPIQAKASDARAPHPGSRQSAAALQRKPPTQASFAHASGTKIQRSALSNAAVAPVRVTETTTPIGMAVHQITTEQHGWNPVARAPRSYAGERSRQVLRWLSSLILQRFPRGIEIQCYFDQHSGTILVSSNLDAVNREIEAFFGDRRGMRFLGLAGLTVHARDSDGTSERVRRHLGKMRNIRHYAEASEVYAALAENRFVVMPSLGKKLDNMHAERRIAAVVGVGFRKEMLGGVKRPCMICQLALRLGPVARGGYMFGGGAMLQLEDFITAEQIAVAAADNGLNVKDKKTNKPPTTLDGYKTRIPPAEFNALVLRLIGNHAQANGQVTHISINRQGRVHDQGEDTDSDDD